MPNKNANDNFAHIKLFCFCALNINSIKKRIRRRKKANKINEYRRTIHATSLFTNIFHMFALCVPSPMHDEGSFVLIWTKTEQEHKRARWMHSTSTWMLSVFESILNNEQQQIYQKGENENERIIHRMDWSEGQNKMETLKREKKKKLYKLLPQHFIFRRAHTTRRMAVSVSRPPCVQCMQAIQTLFRCYRMLCLCSQPERTFGSETETETNFQVPIDMPCTRYIET